MGYDYAGTRAAQSAKYCELRQYGIGPAEVRYTRCAERSTLRGQAQVRL